MAASVNRVAALAAAFVIAGVGAPVAAAASGTPGSEYDVTFSGSASAHIVSTSHDNGDGHLTNSTDQTANWKVLDNSPARLWLPSKAQAGAEVRLPRERQAAATRHEGEPPP